MDVMPKGTVLVVEDDRAIRELMMLVLTEENYHVLAAHDRDSLEHALSGNPNLVLFDLKVPGLDAASLSKRLRNDHHTAHIALVVVSGFAPHQAPDGLVADAWLPKPFDLDQLCQIVETWTRHSDTRYASTASTNG